MPLRLSGSSDDAPLPPPPQRPRQAVLCHRCGYDISEIAAVGGIGTCPECGAPVDIAARTMPRWPGPFRAGLVLIGPIVLLMLIDVAGHFIGGPSYRQVLAGIFGGFRAPAWMFWPPVGAAILTARHAYPSERWIVWIGLAVLGWVLATVLGLLWLILIAASSESRLP